MAAEMRLRFNDDEIKQKVVNLAFDLDISANQLVNMILAAQFSVRDRNQLQLSLDLLAFKREKEHLLL